MDQPLIDMGILQPPKIKHFRETLSEEDITERALDLLAKQGFNVDGLRRKCPDEALTADPDEALTAEELVEKTRDLLQSAGEDLRTTLRSLRELPTPPVKPEDTDCHAVLPDGANDELSNTETGAIVLPFRRNEGHEDLELKASKARHPAFRNRTPTPTNPTEER